MSAKRSTVYVAGLPAAVNEDQLLATFVTFGDILEISMPHEQHDGGSLLQLDIPAQLTPASKHRGYAFITFAEAADAQEAIDNYDLNELPGYVGQGKFLKCSIANPNKYGGDASGKHDRACELGGGWADGSVGERGVAARERRGGAGPRGGGGRGRAAERRIDMYY
jgi:RNA recognition motif-containing protein